jgi:hypothetical protein
MNVFRLLAGFMRAAGVKTPKPQPVTPKAEPKLRNNPPLWEAVIDGDPVRAFAPTKSEARAEMKRLLGGLRRLPPGTKLRRVKAKTAAA